eukprot:scaffold1183_cov418-Prasinococcus_capsulatus_cf.AAC.5
MVQLRLYMRERFPNHSQDQGVTFRYDTIYNVHAIELDLVGPKIARSAINFSALDSERGRFVCPVGLRDALKTGFDVLTRQPKGRKFAPLDLQFACQGVLKSTSTCLGYM